MTEAALRALARMPRVGPFGVKPLPNSRPPRWWAHYQKDRGVPNDRMKEGIGEDKHQAHLPLGWYRQRTPFYMAVPRERAYNDAWLLRRPLRPLSLLSLQRMFELGRLDASRPVDLAALCATGLLQLAAMRDRCYGVMLTDEGLDAFRAPLVLEVQHAPEHVIAAVERAGGRLVTRFFDLQSVEALQDPRRFFRRGLPLPRCRLPPHEAVEAYADPRRRGYLAAPDAVEAAREELAQKYGYALPAAPGPGEALYEAWAMRKSQRQVFYGLQPGWLVSLADRTVYKPQDAQINDYYGAEVASDAAAGADSAAGLDG